MFTGFTPQTVEFLWNIRFHNERPWFEANKSIYQQGVLGPVRALGEALYDHMEAAYPHLWLNLHVSRIYRDARRLHGRGPYKDHLWFTLRHENEAWTSRPVFYFEISPEGYSYGMGFYSAAPALMERFRQETAQNPGPLEQLARRLNRDGRFLLEGETYARPKPSHSPLLAPWMNRKSISLCRDLPYDECSFSPALAEEVAAGYDFLVPYYTFFARLCAEDQGEFTVL